eukprot:TRINITY_DN1525_c0_g1_i3.p1 TRINITY_DN1525_c0_g1~~TRINITY_DN1525_c0_g1_i3.p1  ORF type:complete len:1000 (-),score=212.38 TRINITY_DN1525_c0_g1_i3:14-3013(-)
MSIRVQSERKRLVRSKTTKGNNTDIKGTRKETKSIDYKMLVELKQGDVGKKKVKSSSRGKKKKRPHSGPKSDNYGRGRNSIVDITKDLTEMWQEQVFSIFDEEPTIDAFIFLRGIAAEMESLKEQVEDIEELKTHLSMYNYVLEENKNLKSEIEEYKSRLDGLLQKSSTLTGGNILRSKGRFSVDTKVKKDWGRTATLKTPYGIEIPHLVISDSWNEHTFNQHIEFHDLQRFNFNSDDFSIEKELFNFEENSRVATLIKGMPSNIIEITLLPRSSGIRSFFNYQKFLTEFLYTFPLYLKLDRIIEFYIAEYDSLSYRISGIDLQIKRSILNVFREFVFLDDGYYLESSDITKLLIPFLSDRDEDMKKEKAEILDHVMRKISGPTFDDRIPHLISMNGSFQDIENTSLAEQITLITYDLLKKIRIKELLSSDWTDKRREDNCPNVVNLIKFSNNLADLATTIILKQGNSKKASNMISYFIQVLEDLYNLKNFNAMMCLLGSLHSLPVSKLKSSWNHISKKSKDLFASFTNLLDSSSRYANYNAELFRISPTQPCIPVFALSLENLTKLNETTDNRDEDNFVNWEKMSTLTDIILKMKKFTGVYDIEPDMNIQNFILNSELWTSEEANWQITQMKENGSEFDNFVTKDLWSHSLLSERDWKFLFTGSVTRQFKSGKKIIRTSKPLNTLHRLVSGIVRVEIGDHLLILEPGDFFDIVALLRETSGFKYITEGTTTVELIEMQKIRENCTGNHDISRSLYMEFALKASKILDYLTDTNSQPNNRGSLSKNTDVNIQRLSNIDIDKKFQKIFSIREVVVRTFSCSYKQGSTSASGVMYITQNFLCFRANSFGYKLKTIIPFNSIEQCVKKDTKIRLSSKGKNYRFSNFRNTPAAYSMIQNIVEAQVKHIDLTYSMTVFHFKQEYSAPDDLTEEQWQTLLEGSSTYTYDTGDVIITQGQEIGRIYQVVQGYCLLQKKGQPAGVLSEDAIFGDIVLIVSILISRHS